MSVVSVYAEDHCGKTLTELFKDNKYSSSVNKLLKLQGKLTLHRLTWALTNKVDASKNFKLEEQIDSILNEMNNKDDPAFIEAYGQFNKNKLSRTALAKILPFIKNILNEQNSILNPDKRKKYMIQESDIKILAILAENERKNSDGTYNDSLLSNRESIGSVLNFTKVINSSLRKRSIDKNLNQTLKNQIEALFKKIKDIINDLPISDYCKQIILQSCSDSSDSKISNSSNIFSIIKSLDMHNSQEQLKYGDFWLHVGKRRQDLAQNENIKEQSYELPIEVIPEVDKKEEYLNKLATFVLDNFPYFLSRDELLANEELLMSLVHTIDNKLKRFVYKNTEYILPERYNPTQFKEKGKEIYDNTFVNISITPTDRKLNLPHVQLIDEKRKKLRELKSLIPLEIKDEKQREEFYYTIIAANEITPALITFDFKGAIYDTKTGKKLPRSIDGLLSYPTDKTDTQYRHLTFEAIPERQRQTIIDNVDNADRFYMFDNEVYSISNIPVNTNDVKGLQSPKVEEISISESTNKSLTEKQVSLAILNNKKVVKIGANLYNPITLESYSYKKQEDILARFQRSNGVSPNSLLAFNSDKRESWFQSVINNRDTFQHDGNIFSSITTEKIQSEMGSIYDGFYNHNKYLEIENNLNKLNDKDLVIEFNKKFRNKSTCNYYTIVDKKEQNLSVYNKDGKVLFSKEILLGDIKSDKRTIFYSENYPEERKTNQTTSAGIFYSQDFRDTSDNEYYDFFNNNILALVTEKDAFSGPLNENGDYETVLAIHQTPVGYEYRNSLFNNQSKSDNRATNGCLNMLPRDFEEYKKMFPDMGCPIYILPEEDSNRMIVKNGKINFRPKNQDTCNSGKICNQDYYFSPLVNEESKPISIALMNPARSDNINIKKFNETLERNKNELMSKLKITNSEYNTFARLAYAIFGVESQFGDSTRYKIKEGRILASETSNASFFTKMKSWISENITQNLGQTIVSTAKTLDGNYSTNSRGLTQIKDITDYTKKYYPHINEDNLTKPENAAIATMIVLKSMSDRLKRVKDDHYNVTSDNYDEFLYYIYNGASSLITNGNATPELNIKTRRLRRYLDEVIIYQKK